MTWQKRLMDILLAVLGALLLFVPFLILLCVLLVVQGRPLFYVSERMSGVGVGFRLWKLRTMTNTSADSGVTGGDKLARYTYYGKRLRRLRLDEIPQLWNVFIGDMSVVGPRPPLRSYTEDYPDIYGKVLKSQPGITGLATLAYHQHETELLAQCKSSEETDAVYRRRCIPAKARLDLIYQEHQSVCYDLAILGQTIAKVFSVRKARHRK